MSEGGLGQLLGSDIFPVTCIRLGVYNTSGNMHVGVKGETCRQSSRMVRIVMAVSIMGRAKQTLLYKTQDRSLVWVHKVQV